MRILIYLLVSVVMLSFSQLAFTQTVYLSDYNTKLIKDIYSDPIYDDKVKIRGTVIEQQGEFSFLVEDESGIIMINLNENIKEYANIKVGDIVRAYGEVRLQEAEGLFLDVARIVLLTYNKLDI